MNLPTKNGIDIVTELDINKNKTAPEKKVTITYVCKKKNSNLKHIIFKD